MAQQQDVGDSVRLRASFTNLAKEAADPTTVECVVLRPDQTTISPAPVKDGVGQYHADVTLNVPGVWHWRISGTGTVDATTEGSIIVRPRRVP